MSKRKRKIHLRREFGAIRTACSTWAPNAVLTTADYSGVTCKACKQFMATNNVRAFRNVSDFWSATYPRNA